MDRESGIGHLETDLFLSRECFQLPVKSVEVGWECLQDEFHKLMDVAKKKKDHDDIFDQLKGAVIDTAVSKHVWEDKAAEVLKVIQLNTLEDR